MVFTRAALYRMARIVGVAAPRLADVPGVAHAEQITMERKILGALTVIWPWLDAVFSLGLLLLAGLVH
jgi:hypothetical protein